MPEPPANHEPVVYQLRVVLRGVSPLIWRRLLIRSDSTIADLHASLQLILGWSDEHLNRFVIQGREYGVWHDGGIGFRDNPRHVRLADLGLRVRAAHTPPTARPGRSTPPRPIAGRRQSGQHDQACMRITSQAASSSP